MIESRIRPAPDGEPVLRVAEPEVAHPALAEEAGDFTFDDVARGVIAKMERRNPHVFGDAVATDAAEVLRLWNAAKAAEKAEKAEQAEKAGGR